MSSGPPHLIIAGGGLAGGLAALALAKWQPEVRVTLVEPGAIGGNHLWSFFGSDLAEADWPLVEPLIGHRWPGYQVRFPQHQRRLAQPYYSIESEALAAAVRAALPAEAIVTASVTALTPQSVTLDDGRLIEADTVIDARGLAGPPEGMVCGWQKFVGRLVEVPAGHGLAEPIVMDATVDQTNGYRFVYALPFSPTTLFVEDTYYSDSPEIDVDQVNDRIGAWLDHQAMVATPANRVETGVLPVVVAGDFDKFWPPSDPVARAGVRAGLVQYLTSYSLPDAVRYATWIAQGARLDATLGVQSRALAKAHWRRGWFDRMLGRMLFRAAAPAERYRVLQRYYTLPAPLIERFYAGRSVPSDRLRVLLGKPPVGIFQAIKAVFST